MRQFYNGAATRRGGIALHEENALHSDGGTARQNGGRANGKTTAAQNGGTAKATEDKTTAPITAPVITIFLNIFNGTPRIFKFIHLTVHNS